MRLLILFVFTLVLAPPAAARAQQTTPAPTQETGAGLRIFLMTFSPGSIIYERFGHNTIVVHDPSPPAERVAERMAFEAQIGGRLKSVRPLLPTDRAHHYGAFDFEQEGFVPRFVMGRMEYWTTSDWADLTALSYGADDRSVLLQELNLTPKQKLDVKQFLEWSERPENRFYRYDYYRDNCSTRVRDAIDRATGGELARQLRATPTDMTYRAHTRRLTSGLDPLDVFWFTGFTYVLGHPVDRPLSAWEGCFLPGELARHVRDVKLPDATAPGGTKPLVLDEQELFTTTRPPRPDRDPSRIGGYLIAGVIVGGLFAGLGRLGRRGQLAHHSPSPGTPGEGGGEGSSRSRGKHPHPNPVPEYRESGWGARVARLAFALLVIPWSLLWGVGGLIAANGWAFTDHAASYRNENLLQFSPLILPLVVLGPTVAFGKRRGARAAVVLAITMAALSTLGLLLKMFPAFWQHNGETIALALPANVGLAVGLFCLTTRASAIKQAEQQTKQEPPSSSSKQEKRSRT